MIEARQLQIAVGAKLLLDDVSAVVEPGVVLAVVGPNGSGKSTLRKALSGDIKPVRGQVLMDNLPLDNWALAERAKVRAVMGQTETVNFPFTALEIVLMGRSPHVKGAEGWRDIEIARGALSAAEADHLEERLYQTLSAGERQRVQLARALAQIWEKPDEGSRYLLLDEPTSNLDLAHQHSALRLTRELARQGVGVMVILHDLNLTAQYADRVIMLREGRVVATGEPKSVLNSKAISHTFDISVVVTTHPKNDCPLVVPIA